MLACSNIEFAESTFNNSESIHRKHRNKPAAEVMRYKYSKIMLTICLSRCQRCCCILNGNLHQLSLPVSKRREKNTVNHTRQQTKWRKRRPFSTEAAGHAVQHQQLYSLLPWILWAQHWWQILREIY